MIVPGSENEKNYVAELIKKHKHKIQEKNSDKKFLDTLDNVNKKCE